jgi:endonuclease G, mitochondrial
MLINVKQRTKPWVWKLIGICFFFLITLYGTVSLGDLNFGNIHLLLGNPSQASTDVNNFDNYLILRPQYALSYNRSKGIANWVSWQLNKDWLGKQRRPAFMPDSTLPRNWYRVSPSDYSGSGFDRGHMVPAADRNKTEVDSKSVFLMTNILPQAPDNNQGPWEKLESYCRELVKQGKELYIISGGSGTGGIGTNGAKTTIANGKITVPKSTWKIVVVLEKPGLRLNDITNSTRVIAVDLPNEQGIKDKSWKTFRTSVDQIESLTGYDFLSNVPKAIQDVIEANVDSQ